VGTFVPPEAYILSRRGAGPLIDQPTAENGVSRKLLAAVLVLTAFVMPLGGASAGHGHGGGHGGGHGWGHGGGWGGGHWGGGRWGGGGYWGGGRWGWGHHGWRHARGWGGYGIYPVPYSYIYAVPYSYGYYEPYRYAYGGGYHRAYHRARYVHRRVSYHRRARCTC